MNALNVIRVIIAVIIVVVLVDLVWDKVNVIPVTVRMPWWGFLGVLVVLFLGIDWLVTKWLERLR